MNKIFDPITIASFLLASIAMLLAQSTARSDSALDSNSFFDFVTPWSGVLPKSAVDLSFLSPTPAGSHGYIEAKNGHFYEQNTGRRIRFFGMNLTFDSCFPSHANAEKIAVRLSQLGINIVRIHHHDFNWGQLWEKGDNSHRKIDPNAMDRLDYLIAQLKAHGIYVNLNAHVSRQFTPEDGFPESVNNLPDSYSKRIDNIDPRMIELQKEFMKDYYLHVNPYTKLSYASDPCVAVVEINNENSLVGSPWESPTTYFQELPEPFKGEVKTAWNKWLLKKYGDDENLRDHWSSKGSLAKSVHSSSKIEDAVSRAKFSLQDNSGQAACKETEPGSYRIDNPENAEPAWRIQALITGLPFENRRNYTVSFEARSNVPRKIEISAKIDEADWRGIGLDQYFETGSEFKRYEFTFTANNSVPNHGRLSFTVGGSTGIFEISSLSVHETTIDDLLKGETLESRSIDIPSSQSGFMITEWVNFLADAELDYADRMRKYLRDTLHMHANIIDTQIGYGGKTSFRREAESDFTDNHSYWQQPIFPGKPWDSVNWRIENTPMVSSLADGHGGALWELAEHRVAGKPYSVSEYNHPAPSDYRVEGFPILASFASFQDWDAIYAFDYGSYGDKGGNDKISGFFSTGSDPARASTLPWAAYIFRNGIIPIASRTRRLKLPESDLIKNESIDKSWSEDPGNKKALLDDRFSVDPPHSDSFGADKKSDSAFSRFPSDNHRSIELIDADSGPVYTARSSAAAAFVGYIGGATFSAENVSIKTSPFANNFGIVTIVALDQKPMTESGRMLLTAIGNARNMDMLWNKAHTSVGSDWGNFPSQALGIPAQIRIATDRPIHVWALDSAGKRDRKISVVREGRENTFSIGPTDKAVWYELATN